jgi:hypothetical protein
LDWKQRQVAEWASTQSRDTWKYSTKKSRSRLHAKSHEAYRDLAALYGVETRRLNEQVRRNQQRFPPDFIFEVSDEEVRNLMSQFATSSWGGTRKRPLAFTEHGAIMAATVLNSPGAVEMSVFVVRAFVQFRTALLSTRELAKRLDALERHVATKLTVHDRALTNLLKAIRSLTESPATRKRPIGFTADLDGSE